MNLNICLITWIILDGPTQIFKSNLKKKKKKNGKSFNKNKNNNTKNKIE